MDNREIVNVLADKLHRRIEADAIEVPMLQKVVSRVIRLTQDTDSDAEDLARLIQSDPPLAGHVMRIANSAIYSPNTTLVSLQQAIARLGMRVIAEIALAASINSKMFNAPGYSEFVAQQLKFSLHSGVWAKEIARACRRNVEAAFLAGLLHDIGRPVALQALLTMDQTRQQSLSHQEVLTIVNQFVSVLSGKVVHSWELPTSVCEIVEHISAYQNAGKAKEQTMIVVAGTHFAAQFSKIEGRVALPKDAFLANPVFADLNLYQDDIVHLTEKADQVHNVVEAMSV